MKTGKTEITQWQRHQARWGEGCGADACDKANRVCLARGKLPCTVLFLGEAPGPSENVSGIPFDGPAGHLLARQIERAVISLDAAPTMAWSNLVGCIPLDEDGSKFTEPPDEQVKACGPRLVDLIETADPRLIVCVGKLSWEWLDPDFRHSIKLRRPIAADGKEWPAREEVQFNGKGTARGLVKPQVPTAIVQIVHPAAILRAPVAAKTSMSMRAVVALKNAFEALEGKS